MKKNDLHIFLSVILALSILMTSCHAITSSDEDTPSDSNPTTEQTTDSSEPKTGTVNTVTISGDSVVTVGNTITLKAIIAPSNSAETTVIWTETDDTGKATITSDGKLTGKAAGKIMVTAKVGSIVSGTFVVIVTDSASTGSTDGASDSLTGTNGTVLLTNMRDQSITVSYDAGKTLQNCRLYLTPGDDTAGRAVADGMMTASGTVYSYTATHATYIPGKKISVIIVANDGSEKMVPQGTLGDSTTWMTVTYPDAPVVNATAVYVSGSQSVSYAGSVQLTATVLPVDTTNKSVVWNVTNGSGTATITSTGKLTGTSAGTVSVSATCGSVTSELFTVNVAQPIAVQSVSISGDNCVAVNKKISLSASVVPQNAYYDVISWNVTNGTGAATITSGGKLTGTVEGTVNVTASAGSVTSAAYSVTVTAASNTGGSSGSSGDDTLVDDYGTSGLFVDANMKWTTYGSMTRGSKANVLLNTWESASVGVNSDNEAVITILKDSAWRGVSLCEVPYTAASGSYYDFTKVASITFDVKSADITSNYINVLLQNKGSDMTDFSQKSLASYGAGTITDWTKVTIPVASADRLATISTALAITCKNEGTTKKGDVIYIKNISFNDVNGDVTSIIDKINFEEAAEETYTSKGLFLNSNLTWETACLDQHKIFMGRWEASYVGVSNDIATFTVKTGNVWKGAAIAQVPKNAQSGSYFDLRNVENITFKMKSTNINPEDIKIMIQNAGKDIGDYPSNGSVNLTNYYVGDTTTHVSDITNWTQIRVPVTSSARTNTISTALAIVAFGNGTAGASVDLNDSIEITEIDFVDASGNSVDIAQNISFDSIFDASGRTLIWSDEFDESTTSSQVAPDATKWNYDTGTGADGDGWGNNEVEVYTASTAASHENAYVSNGTIKIKAIVDDKGAVTSARMTTNGTKDFTHGYIEFRAKLPTERGSWPALWMLGSNLSTGTEWPDCGELDIMEYSTNFWGNQVYCTAHCRAGYGGNPVATNGSALYNVQDEWHTYAIDWQSTYIKWYVDGVCLLTYNNPDATFSKDFYLLMNVAVGGTLGGDWSSMTEAVMEVDYVRIYN
jgi:hypothetical protein